MEEIPGCGMKPLPRVFPWGGSDSGLSQVIWKGNCLSVRPNELIRATPLLPDDWGWILDPEGTLNGIPVLRNDNNNE